MIPAERVEDMIVKFLKSLFGFGRDPREALIPLYGSVVAEARDPTYYAEFGVPDTLDGRFDMIAAILSLTLMRIEKEGEGGRETSALLTELFIEDMEGQVRQIGIGDVIVGKHLGKMVAAMGGRFTVYSAAIDDKTALSEGLVRNIWRGEPGPDAQPDQVAERLRAVAARLATIGWDDLLARGIAG